MIGWKTHWRFRRRPFRSLHRAQFWFECRANSILPLFIGAVMILFIFVPALEINDVALGWRLLAGAPDADFRDEFSAGC